MSEGANPHPAEKDLVPSAGRDMSMWGPMVPEGKGVERLGLECSMEAPGPPGLENMFARKIRCFENF